jgi:hypothetical protein
LSQIVFPVIHEILKFFTYLSLSSLTSPFLLSSMGFWVKIATGSNTRKILTDALFRWVHKDVRSKERQRQWTLHYLVQFWTAVILRAPILLTQALNDARGLVGDKVRDNLYPPVESRSEAFFEKCRDLKWQLFHSVYERFTESILPEAPRNYGTVLGHIFEHFGIGPERVRH